jgi:hypothetical protein
MFPSIHLSTRAWAMSLAAAVAIPAWAQSPGVSAASTRVPVYQSAFDGYRGFTDQAIKGWAAANQHAADVGGWRAYARAARTPAEGDAVTPAPASAGSSHAGHGGQSSHSDHSSHHSDHSGHAGGHP